MWICPKCQNENEENFRFCWGCGATRSEIKNEPEIRTAAPPPKTETSKPPEPIKRQSIENRSEPKANRNIENDEDVLPMLARVSGTERKTSVSDTDVSLERKIFTIAVRLVGLFLFYHVLVGIPDLAVMIYSALSDETTDGAAILFTAAFVIPAAKLLFYLIVGVYLIASGRILLWLLPR